MLSLLGWSFATKESKRRPFSRKADTLGAVMDLSQSEADTIMVANKPSRIEDLRAVRDSSPIGTWFSQAQAASLRGRVVYAESQVFSRAASAMMPRLKARALPSAHGQPVDQEFLEEIDFIIRFLRDSVPRTIVANDPRRPLIIFTDASLSDDLSSAGVGAVMMSQHGKPKEFISEEVPRDMLAVLQSETPHVITSLEVLPVYLARSLWGSAMAHRRVFIFIDNDGARHSLIKTTTGSPSVMRVLRNLVHLQAATPCFAWYARVPSPSNIADAPSRLDVRELVASGARRRPIEMRDWRAALE